MAMASYSPRSSTAPTGWEPAYGGVPNLPPYTTDTTRNLGTDVQANIVKNLPGYMNMVGADVANIGSNLQGSLSPDVIQQMQQQAAERGIETGSPGSPNTNAAYLRALGLTSLQLQQLGHTQLNEAIARTPVQQDQTTTATHDLGAERAVYAAAPYPGAAARQAITNAQMGYGYTRGAGGGGVYGGPMTITPAAATRSWASQNETPWTDWGAQNPSGYVGRTGEFQDGTTNTFSGGFDDFMANYNDLSYWE